MVVVDETQEPTSSAPPASTSDLPPSPSGSTAVAVVDELAGDPRYDRLRPKTPRERPSARPESLEPPTENAAIWWEAIVQLSVCDVPPGKIAKALNRTPAAVRRVLMTAWAERRAEELRPLIRKAMLESTLDARAQFTMAAPHVASVMIAAVDDVAAKPLQRAIIAEKCLAIAGIQAEKDPRRMTDEDLLDGLNEEQLESFVEGREIPAQLKPHLAPPIEVEATPVDEPAEVEG